MAKQGPACASHLLQLNLTYVEEPMLTYKRLATSRPSPIQVHTALRVGPFTSARIYPDCAHVPHARGLAAVGLSRQPNATIAGVVSWI